MEFIDIKSGQGDYKVFFLSELDDVIQSCREIDRAVYLIDSNVSRLYVEPLQPIMNSQSCLRIDALEESKTLEGVARVIKFLQATNCSRHNVLVAVGGGIVQDIATFVSHVYHRGMKLVLVPTTLLAMSDSCIGAKSGINFEMSKNQIGVFQSPSKVLVCPKFVDTLSESDIKSGYGEILKLMLIGSEAHFDKFHSDLNNFGFNLKPDDFIRLSLSVKKKFIEADEYESDLRRILNYGHTFGHALESATNHEICHGVAVAWGIDMANFISMKMNLLVHDRYQTISKVIRSYFNVNTKINVQDIMTHVRRDKKAAQGNINLVLLRAPGDLHIVPMEIGTPLGQLVEEFLR